MNQIVIKEQNVAERIYFIRGEKVLLDLDLASLYQIDIRRFREAVRRNLNRFPEDFMFQLTQDEHKSLEGSRISKRGQHAKYMPFVFSEQGVAMLSSVLNSDRAIEINITIMRAFVQMRRFIESNKDILAKVQELEDTMQERFSKQDDKIKDILDVIKHLICENSKPKPQVGFQT